MDILNKILTVFYIVVGVYFIYSGVVRKGRLFENPNIKNENKDEFKKLMSIFLLCSGPLLIAGGVIELLGFSRLYYMCCYGAVLVFAMILLAKLKKMTGRG